MQQDVTTHSNQNKSAAVVFCDFNFHQKHLNTPESWSIVHLKKSPFFIKAAPISTQLIIPSSGFLKGGLSFLGWRRAPTSRLYIGVLFISEGKMEREIDMRYRGCSNEE